MSLPYYTSHSPLTDPGPYAELFDTLPDDPAGLVRTIHGLLIHKLVAQHYGVHMSMVQRDEQNFRTIRQRLARIVELDPAPLNTPRDPAGRQVGVCRDFALLLVSMLRHKGFPARMRVGFAEYLIPDGPVKADHWISEYWNGERWVLVDPQVDDVQRTAFHITANTLDLRHDQDFYVAGSAWQLARAGKVKSTYFRFNGTWKGYPCIRGNMLHDFQALNKIELTPRDAWDELALKDERDLTIDDKTLLDQIAALTAPPDDTFAEQHALFEQLPRTQLIRDRLRMLGVILPGPDENGTSTVNSSELQPSDANRLAVLASSQAPNGSHDTEYAIRHMEYVPYDPAPHMTSDTRSPDSFGPGDIVVRGARQHNLKNVTVRIPRHKLVVITGVSGSGKSSLAFDTLYAEGQRRYVESLSSYARQFMGQMEKPKVDQITGLSPAIAIEQKTVSKNPRSTVGTVTEILDYLRVLYARIGLPHCPQCGRAVQPQTAQQITTQLAALPAGTRFQLLAPVATNRKGTHASTLKQAAKDGYARARVNGEMVDLLAPKSWPELDKNKKHTLEVIVDRLVIPNPEEFKHEGHEGTQREDLNLRDLRVLRGEKNDWQTRLTDSVETTLKLGGGVVIVVLDNEEIILSEHHACPHCDISFPELQPQMFSFNSAFGMCPDCNGLGVQLQVDPNLIITHPEMSLYDGASAWHGNVRKKGKSQWTAKHLEAIAEHYGVSLETPWNDLPDSFKHVYLYGSGEEKIHFSFESNDGAFSGESYRESKGAVFQISRLFRQTKSDYTRRFYMSFMAKLPCPKCEGERLCPEARFTTVAGVRLPELGNWSIEAVHEWVRGLPAQLNVEQRQIADELLLEIVQRLGFLRNVGLHYLTLDRPAPTLSGGEGQRIRLASQIGSGLVGVLYILDEPSIGLHTRDHRALLDTLTHLRDIGNTVLVVEHDADTMRAADWLIDLGPGPGVLGGKVISEGTPDEVMADADSITGQYLTGVKQITRPNGIRRTPSGWLTVRGARVNNLKGGDFRFPVGVMTVVTGVSGSGKSSLVAHTLHPALSRILHGAQSTPGAHDGIDGLEQVDKVIHITQDPIGRNPRSNPGTYAGVMDDIRAVFATMPEAKARGYGAGRFSMNTKGGRCEACAGYGVKKVEMHFLPDVYVRCNECGGLRFNRQTLEITVKGKTIAEVMDMDVQEALAFFAHHPKITQILQTLHDVGLDYMKLGQSALTLSGGEAQRVKLAKELSRAATGRTVYILDEPTTGLHFADIQRLLDVLHRLVDAGNTVIIIEHNMDVIRSADWVLDLGPEGGDRGGYVVAEGSPEEVSQVEGSYTGRFLREGVEDGTRMAQINTDLHR